MAAGEVVRPFENVSNFRDIGGRTTADGRTLKTGVLFRSDELSRMTIQDRENLRRFNIRLICDLRCVQESRKKQTRVTPDMSIRLVHVPMHEQAIQDKIRWKVLRSLFGSGGEDRFRECIQGYYHHIAFEQTARIREVFTLLAAEGSLPALIHCTAGRDRTGLLAALLQLLAGVPYDAVREEYLLSNDYFAPRLEALIKRMRFLSLLRVPPERMRLLMTAHPEFLDSVYATILQKYGTVEGYLREACAIEDSTLSALKKQLLGEIDTGSIQLEVDRRG